MVTSQTVSTGLSSAGGRACPGIRAHERWAWGEFVCRPRSKRGSEAKGGDPGMMLGVPLGVGRSSSCCQSRVLG